ncbi:MAG: rhomboid family intramembrane serine protease [Chitinophagaceae bacterium]
MTNYSSGGGFGSMPPVIKSLLIINVVVYIAQRAIPGLTEWGALHYWTSDQFKPHQLVTMMFMHDPSSIWHLAFNMLALWMFGSVLENFWSSKRFLNFYMICGIGASIVTLLSVPFSATQYANHHPELLAQYDIAQLIGGYKEQYSALGASGAIMGVMAAFAYLFPNTEMYMMFIPIPVKAKYAIPCFVLYDLISGLGIGIKGDNVAHFAHLGGALIGILIVILWNKTNRKNFY